MARTTFYVGMRPEGGWHVWREGSAVLTTSATQQDALDYAVDLTRRSQPSQVMLQRTDGQWENYATYGDDPYPPRG